ncbi:MAG: hypothetical protein E6J39_04300 [Chloroflexi bacterium]|nr:MAG: hypothetical protein E6J39_04300 [Chloroflexota bacterium]
MAIIGRGLRANGRVALGVAAALGLGAILAARSGDPFVADPAAVAALRSTIALQRTSSVAQLERLATALTAALDEGRQGAALTIQGTDRPGPHLEAAAQSIANADPLVADAQALIRRLAGELAVWGRAAPEADLALEPGKLASIGAQLRTSAGAADAFWSMRRATETTLTRLAEAFAAVDARDPGRALAAIDAAEASLGKVRTWPGSLLTLPIWTKATGDLLAALRSLAVAIRDHDLAGARAAEARYRTSAATAHRADIALAVAIAEGGSAASDNPLAAAASALRSVEEALVGVRSILA